MSIGKLHRAERAPGVTAYLFYCPGCECYHSYDVRSDGGRPAWSFNGDMDRPTFTPSLLYPDRRCHLYLTDGRLHFQGDCSHALAGRTVDLPDFDDDQIG